MEGQLCKGKKRSVVVHLNDVYYQDLKIHPAPPPCHGVQCKPGKTTLKYSLKKNELKICQSTSTSTSISRQQVKPQKKTKKNKKNSSNMHKGSTVFSCEIPILIPNCYCK